MIAQIARHDLHAGLTGCKAIVDLGQIEKANDMPALMQEAGYLPSQVSGASGNGHNTHGNQPRAAWMTLPVVLSKNRMNSGLNLRKTGWWRFTLNEVVVTAWKRTSFISITTMA